MLLLLITIAIITAVVVVLFISCLTKIHCLATIVVVSMSVTQSYTHPTYIRYHLIHLLEACSRS